MLISLLTIESVYTHINIYIYIGNGVSGYKLLERKVLRSMKRKRKINMIYDLEVMQLLGIQ